MQILPFPGAGCGVLVDDIQLAELSDIEVKNLRVALAKHGVLFFREQRLAPDEHLRFAHRFGDLVKNKFFSHNTEFPDIAEVRKDPDQETNLGGGWHTDHSYEKEPAMASILVARELPDSGGDTCFAHLGKAYDNLSPKLQKTLETLEAVHCNEHVYGEKGYYQSTDMARQVGGTNATGRTAHPVVIRHPETGRKLLYVNPAFTLNFVGWTPKQSRPLLTYLFRHVNQPRYICRFNWEPGSVAIWDNRSTWHNAINDYPGQARLMHRITLAGGALEAAAKPDT